MYPVDLEYLQDYWHNHSAKFFVQQMNAYLTNLLGQIVKFYQI